MLKGKVARCRALTALVAGSFVAVPTILSQEAAYADTFPSSHANRLESHHEIISPGRTPALRTVRPGAHDQRPLSFNQLLAHATSEGINRAVALDAYFDAVRVSRHDNVPWPMFERIANQFIGRLRAAGNDLDAVAGLQGVFRERDIRLPTGGHFHVLVPPRFHEARNLDQFEGLVARFRQEANNGDRLLVRATDQTTGTHVWFNVLKTRDVSRVPDEQKRNPDAGTPLVLFGDSRRPAFGGYLRALGENGVGGQLSEDDRSNLHNFHVLIT